MNKVTVLENKICSMSESEIEKVFKLENEALKMPQVKIETFQTLHGGVYTRTVTIPAGIMITGATIKIPTTLIVCGEVLVFIGNKTVTMKGYNVLKADGNRKQVFFAKTDTTLTMIFATKAVDFEEAESEFTNEVNMLITRRNDSEIE